MYLFTNINIFRPAWNKWKNADWQIGNINVEMVVLNIKNYKVSHHYDLVTLLVTLTKM